jgi:hypothetical protein
VEPELLFGLRKVDAKELIARAGEGDALPQKAPRAARILDSSKLADVFGIDVSGVEPKPSGEPPTKPSVKRKTPSTPRKGKAATGLRARAGRKHSGKAR